MAKTDATIPGRSENGHTLELHRASWPKLEQSLLQQATDYVARARMLSGARGAVHFELHVEPPELGTLRISLSEIDGGIATRIVVDREATYQLLERELSGLKQSLQQAGVDTVDVGVSRDDGSGARWNDLERSNQRPQEGEPSDQSNPDAPSHQSGPLDDG